MPRVPVPHGTWGVRLRRTSQLLVLPEVSVLQAEPAQTGESSSTQRWATPPRPFLTPRGRSTSVAAYTTPSRRPHGAPAPAVPQAAQGCPGGQAAFPTAGWPRLRAWHSRALLPPALPPAGGRGRLLSHSAAAREGASPWACLAGEPGRQGSVEGGTETLCWWTDMSGTLCGPGCAVTPTSRVLCVTQGHADNTGPRQCLESQGHLDPWKPSQGPGGGAGVLKGAAGCSLEGEQRGGSPLEREPMRT